MVKGKAKRIKVEITKDDPIGLKKGQVKNLEPVLANRLIKNKQAKLFKPKKEE